MQEEKNAAIETHGSDTEKNRSSHPKRTVQRSQLS